MRKLSSSGRGLPSRRPSTATVTAACCSPASSTFTPVQENLWYNFSTFELQMQHPLPSGVLQKQGSDATCTLLQCIPDELDAVIKLLCLSSICVCTFGERCEALPKGLVSPVEQVALPGQPGQGAGPGRGRRRSVSAPHEVHTPHAPHIRQRRQVAVSALQHSQSSNAF